MSSGSGSAQRSPYFNSSGEQKRRDRRGYRRSLSPSDLVPTRMTGTTSTEIHGPRTNIRASQDYSLKALPPLPAYLSEEESPLNRNGQITQTTTVEQEYYQDIPRLHLRDSFRNSFARGSILKPW